MNITEELSAAGIEVVHHFAGGLYAKEYRMPAGSVIGKHMHSYDHLSSLARGSVMLVVSGEEKIIHAPIMITVQAYKRHEILAITDAVWYCIHTTSEKDPTKVDTALGGWL